MDIFSTPDYEELFPAPKLKADETVQVAQQFVQVSAVELSIGQNQ